MTEYHEPELTLTNVAKAVKWYLRHRLVQTLGWLLSTLILTLIVEGKPSVSLLSFYAGTAWGALGWEAVRYKPWRDSDD